MEEPVSHNMELPEYAQLVTARKRLVWPLLLITILTYLGFILMVAFFPELLGRSVGKGVVSVGIIVGLILILFNFFITLLYVYRANKVIEPLIENIHQKKKG